MSEVVDVWLVKMPDYTQGTCVHRSLDDAMNDVRANVEELCDGQAVTVEIRKDQMTESALDALPEFDGY